MKVKKPRAFAVNTLTDHFLVVYFILSNVRLFTCRTPVYILFGYQILHLLKLLIATITP